VGFFKPSTDAADPDGALMKSALSMKEPVDQICPNMGDAPNPAALKDAFARIVQGKDVILVEGDTASQASHSVATALDAGVLVVDDESAESPGDQLIAAQKLYGESLVGVILNKVPQSQAERVRSQAPAAFAQAGVPVFGVLPEDRALFTVTIGELADQIHGSFLNNPEKAGDLAESFMLGAMCVDSGRVYFGRQENKVAVLRSQRADLQLAALQTPTRALVLSGGQPPLPQIQNQAEDRAVPIVQTDDDVPTIVSAIEAALAGSRFTAEKLPVMAGLMDAYVDYAGLYRQLGLVK
jgi:BioD-like phosphotransacetylase family protein